MIARALLLLGFAPALAMANPPWTKHVLHPEARAMINTANAHDWDGDGKMDVISSIDGQILLFQGGQEEPVVVFDYATGDRPKTLRKARPACIHSCLMDADRDGDLDFIGSNLSVFWLECPDDPFSGEPWIYRTIDDEIAGTHCLITGDVNQDGQIDLIANSFQTEKATPIAESITWLEIPEDPKAGTPWPRHVFADGDAPGGNHYMGFGDVNGDGRPDISCGAKGGPNFEGGEWFAWWEQPEDATAVWTKHLLAENQVGATNIIPADLNGDGVTDFFATRGHGHGALWFKGPEFELIEVDPELAYPHSLDVIDLDGDGDLDAVSCGKEADGVAAWYENDGTGAFTKHVIGIDQGSYDTRAIDMDADGDLDVLIAGHASNNLVWFENPGS